MRKINITMNTSSLRVGLLCATLAVGACASNGNSSGGSSNAQSQSTPYSSNRAGAPVVLNLRGPTPTPTAGPITLDLEIVANEPIQAPVYLQIQLPPGTQLVSGIPSETLSLPQAGRYYRQYVVQTQGPLSQPVVVEANAQGPNNAWGFNARRQYPAAVESMPPTPRGPGVGRPPAVRP